MLKGQILKDEISVSEWLFFFIMTILIFVAICMNTGCEEVSPTQDPQVKTNSKQIDRLKMGVAGNANNIKTISTKINQTVTSIKQEQESLLKSLKQRIDKVEGDVNSSVKNVQNSMWYAFGVLGIIGFFFLAALFIFLWFYKGFKGFGRK